eukprot:scaffold2139_cov170-Pinguiococcus_pyrenoidosus.AAC.2
MGRCVLERLGQLNPVIHVLLHCLDDVVDVVKGLCARLSPGRGLQRRKCSTDTRHVGLGVRDIVSLVCHRRQVGIQCLKRLPECRGARNYTKGRHHHLAELDQLLGSHCGGTPMRARFIWVVSQVLEQWFDLLEGLELRIGALVRIWVTSPKWKTPHCSPYPTRSRAVRF